MRESILEAIKQGNWDYEPERANGGEFDSTSALPGTDEKLDILADRIESGLPLWHPKDRLTMEDIETDE